MKDKEENKKPAKKKPLFTFDPSEIEKIPLASLDPAKWNPRKSFDPGPIQDLAKNIEHCGLQQPIIVRKRPEGRYEIIAGERRWRALQLLGASEVPAIVRDMDDLEALKIQMAENVQRQSLNPMEEAEGLARLQEEGKFLVKEVAETLGKHRDYVSRMLLLNRLPEAAKDAVRRGKITARLGWTIGRIPVDSIRIRVAAEALTKENWTPKRIEHWIRSNFTLKLKQAPFPLHSENLVPGEPSCVACPKRVGNCPELYPETKEPWICTDPECFARKREAYWQFLVSRAQAEGTEVLSEKDALREFSPQSTRLRANSEYADLETPCSWDPQGRPWSALLADDLTKDPEKKKRTRLRLFLARSPVGTFHTLVLKQEALYRLKARNYTFAKELWEKAERERVEKEQQARQKEFIEMSVSSLVYEAARRLASGASAQVEDLMLCCITGLVPQEVCEAIFPRHRIEWAPEGSPNPFGQEKRREYLLALMLDLLVMAKLACEPLSEIPLIVRELCRRFEIDSSKVEEEIRHIQEASPKKASSSRGGAA